MVAGDARDFHGAQRGGGHARAEAAEAPSRWDALSLSVSLKLSNEHTNLQGKGVLGALQVTSVPLEISTDVLEAL